MLVILFILNGCVSTTYLDQIQLPISIDSRFKVCQATDGANLIDFFDQGGQLGSIEVEWVHSKSDELVVEGLSPMGQTLARLSYLPKNQNVDLKSSLPNLQNVKVSSDDSGFIEINGHFTPIKFVEMSCLLNATWPKTWLRQVVKSNAVDKDRWRLIYKDDHRRVVMSMAQMSSREKKDCALISWTSYLFWGNQFRVCLTSRSSGALYHEGAKRLGWQILGDG